ncbi:MAG TPA: hypothetical protein VF104_08700, partial [Burkholderiales bacterium]
MRAPFKPATLTALLGASSVAAFALGLGDPSMESVIGQPLRVRIPLLLQPGEAVSPGCITLAPPKAGTGIEQYALPGARAELAADGRSVLVTTSRVLDAPVASFSLHADCAGQRLDRDYTLLPDPPSAPATPATPVAPAPRPAAAAEAPVRPPSGTRWELRAGESVRAIASAIFPDAPGLQQRLVTAIVRASAGAFPEGDPDRP